MATRMLYLKVGEEEVRGPLAESAVRASWASGVLADDTLVGESPETLAPIAQLLGARGDAPMARSSATPGAKRFPVIIALAAVLLALVVVGGVFAWKHRAPALCKATPHVLAGLQAELHVRLYVTRKRPKLDKAAREIERLLAAMKAESKGHMTFDVVDVNDETTARSAKEAGLQEVAMSDGLEADVNTGVFGIALGYRAEKEKIPVLGADAEVASTEFFLINKIRELTARADGKKQRIGVLVGHHEVDLASPHLVPSSSGMSPNMRGIMNQYFPFYVFVDVDLKAGTAGVPDDIDGLLVVGPADDLTEAELRKLDEHVLRGKPLAIFASAATVRAGDLEMKASLSTHGLGRLTSGYGLELGEDLVFDSARAHEVSVATSSGADKMAWPYLLVAKEKEGLDANSPVFFRVPEVIFPLASSIAIRREKQPNATVRALARASSTAVRDVRKEIMLTPLKPARGEGAAGEVVVAASVEGTLTSAFGGAPSTKPARVLVVASGLFFTNPFVYAGPPAVKEGMGAMMATADPLAPIATAYTQSIMTTTILVLKNTLDWLTFDEDMSGCLPLAADPKKR